MTTDTDIDNRISQIVETVISDIIIPFNKGKTTTFIGKDVLVSAGVERRCLAEDGTIVALIVLELYLGSTVYKKNIAVMDIAVDYSDYYWKCRLCEIKLDVEKIFYDLILTMIKDAMNLER